MMLKFASVPALWLSAMLAAWPVAAQQTGQPRDQIQPDQATPGSEAATIMERPLPFRDGQTLHYQDGRGRLEGFAIRRKLTIRFYDGDGKYLGRAVRVSEAATRYYDADGLYLGRRLHRRLIR